MVDNAREATCEKYGLTEGSHCSVCDTILEKQTTINILEHNYSNGVCIHCKAPKPSENLDIGVINEFGKQVAHVYGLGPCTDENIVIPSTYQGAPVTWIWSGAFKDCLTITSVYIPDTVEEIGGSAFSGCRFLKEIRLPSNLKVIENNLFNGCKSLLSVNIPTQIELIEGSAFAECTSLTAIIIPDTVITIGNNAFWKCSGLKELVIPKSVKTIENYAFCKCSSLKKIVVPDSVTTLGKGVFQECFNLTDVALPSGINYLPDFAFAYTSLTAFSVSAKILFIGECAFLACNSLETVYISSNTKQIDESAFQGCKNLKTIYYDGSVEDWQNILKGDDWDRYIEEYTVVCSDDEITKKTTPDVRALLHVLRLPKLVREPFFLS